MDLTEQEKQEIKACLDRGEAVPDKFRFKLFAQPRQTELIWPGKTNEVTNAILPFQVIEHVDEPREEREATTSDLFSVDSTSGRQAGGWTNKLIWGDNKLVLSSLKNGPLRREIEAAGGLKFVYIDPPFDVGADFSFDIEIGEDKLLKEQNQIEEIAYRDTWGRGSDSFVAMIAERLELMHSLLSDDGCIAVHCDWRVNSFIRLVLDEIFGKDCQVNELIWWYKRWSNAARSYQKMHDTIYLYSKNENYTFNVQYQDYAQPEAIENTVRGVVDGRLVRLRDADGNYVPRKTPNKGVPCHDVFDIQHVQPTANERLGYPTQKPERLIERILLSSTNENDLVADFFCGSGTTLAVAEKLGRKWMGADLGRFAIHTSRKRMIDVQRELKRENKPYRSFEILNLGKYERQYFVGIDPTLPPAQRAAETAKREGEYLNLILSAYRSEPVNQSPPFHGRKGSTLVCVGPIDSPVSRSLISECVDAALNIGATSVDVIGFEFEMGLVPNAVEDALQRGVRLAVKYIPKDVFDKRAVEKNQVVFYDVAYLQVQTKADAKKHTVAVTLSDFGVSYRQEDADTLAGEMKPGSKVTVDQGQVVKITKDKQGNVKRDVLTKQWSDWIDYWSVDFDYHSKQELITVSSPDAGGNMVHRPQWTGGYIFENEWQSFRTRRDRKLEMTSAAHTYPSPGKYFVAVKVIDIFGNDTTKIIEVKV